MNTDELMTEECKAVWREEARKQAVQEAKEYGFKGDDALTFLEIRGPEIYAELAELDREDI